MQELLAGSFSVRDPDESTKDAFYAAQYARLYSPLACEIRKEAFGEDLGQESWRSAREQAEIAKSLRLGPGVEVLDVACGAGGPSLAFVAKTGCRLTGVDIAPQGVSAASAEAAKRGLAGLAEFRLHDGADRLPFDDAHFNAVMCIDSICHFPDRLPAMRDWARLLKSGGRLVFTDPFVVTGPISKPEIDGRCALGANLFFTPPGFNERAVAVAGLRLVDCLDRAEAAAEIAERWRAARERRAEALIREEGEEWFGRRQEMLATTARLGAERRLTRFFYVAEKP